jgi:hypothetical protein
MRLPERAAKESAAPDLSAVDHVYLWADGIHVDIRLEEHKLCLLVMIGVRADGRKELIALVRTGAVFVNGKLVERPGEDAPPQAA